MFCARRFQRAWWYCASHDSNLNGIYHQRGSHASITTGDVVFWSTWKSLCHPLLKEGRDENKTSRFLKCYSNSDGGRGLGGGGGAERGDEKAATNCTKRLTKVDVELFEIMVKLQIYRTREK